MVEDKAIVDESSAGAGQSIAFAREQQGWTQEQLAAELKISKHKLSLIEREQFDQVGTDTFVRGYLRNAARVLQLDTVLLLHEYQSYVNKQPKPNKTKPQSSSAALEIKPKANLSPYFIAGTVVLLMWGSFLLFYPTNEDSSTTRRVAEQINSETAAAPNNVDNFETTKLSGDNEASVNNSDVKGVELSTSLSDAPAEQISPIQNADQQANATSVVNRVAEEQQSAAPQLNGTEPPQTAQTRSSESEKTVAAEGASAADDSPSNHSSTDHSSTDESVLLFRFTDSCWLQVRDARGERLYSNTKRAGEELRLQGLPPFRVNLGNVRAVSLELDGESFPLNPSPGRKTLALTIPN